jgi:hypothetical protein
MDSIVARYTYESRRRDIAADIGEHLPTLSDFASRFDVIVECGVRKPISSYAFANGLKGNPNGKLYMIDPDCDIPSVNAFLDLARREGIDATFIHQSDLVCPLIPCDVLFIDTWHVYGQLKRELAYWHSSARSYILLHDTTVDEWAGETVRMGWNADEQSRITGIPVNEICKGLWPAVEEFLREHPEWVVEKRYTNCNGLTILKRIA